jgi:hypothetical protein
LLFFGQTRGRRLPGLIDNHLVAATPSTTTTVAVIARYQGLTLVHVRAPFEQIQDNF